MSPADVAVPCAPLPDCSNYAILCGMPHSIEGTVVGNRSLPNDNHLLAIRAPAVASEARPGQFVMVAPKAFQRVPNPLLKRALAIYSVDPESEGMSLVSVLLKVVGEGTRQLAALRPQQPVSLIGPLGNGFDLDAGRGRTCLLLAGGIGMASLFLLARELRRRGEDVHLVYGGRTGSELVVLDQLRELGLPILVTTDDGSLGYHGHVGSGLSSCLRQFPVERLILYACGPMPMLKEVSLIARDHGIPCQISVEARMACGFGVCLGCTVKTVGSYRLVCTDGPVFDAADFLWEDD